MRIKLWLAAVCAAASMAAQNLPIVTLGAASAKPGDTVSIAIESAGDLSGAHVTLGGKDANFTVQGKRIVMYVPGDQPLGPAGVVVTIAGNPFQARDQLNVIAGSSEPGIDSIRPSPVTPKDQRVEFTIFGHGFSTRVLSMPEDIRLLVDHSQQKAAWHKVVGEARAACASEANIHGTVVSDSEIYFCNVPAKKNGVLPIGLYQGREVVSKAGSLIVSSWNVWTIRTLSFIVAGLVVGLVYFLLSFKGEHIVKEKRYRLRAMLLDKQTNTYSLSILQFHLWTAATLFGYSYFALARLFVQRELVIPDAPSGVPAIVGAGIGASTAVFAQLVQSVKPKGSGDETPSPSDLVTSGGAIAPDRVQMLVWTLVGVFVFLAGVLVQDPASIKELPALPDSLMALMGLSSLGYLGGKFARKPGPNILEISILPAGAMPAEGAPPAALAVDVSEPKAAAAQVLASVKKAASGLTETAAPAAVRETMTAVSALESAVAAAAGVTGPAGMPKLIELADAAHNAAANAAGEMERSNNEVARVGAMLAQRAAVAAQDLRGSVGSLVSAAETSAARRTSVEAQAFRRTIELRGSNLSAEGVFRAKIGEDERDLPFRMLEEVDGVRAPEMVVREETTGNAKFCRTLRLNIVPSRLDPADRDTYNAIFGKPEQEITFAIFNPDGQKATKTIKLPPGEAQRP